MSVTVFPEIVAGPERMLKLTGKLDEALALTLNGGSPNVFPESRLNVIVWFALITVNVRSTGGAALKVALPACDARTVTTPAPVMVTVLPETVAGPETILKLTVSPELAVALTSKGALP